MLTLLKNRNYFWLWLGQTISQVGDQIRDWAMIYWIFTASGGSPVVQSLSFIAVTAPQLVLGPVAGVLVDRWDRRRVMLVSTLLRGFISLGLIAAVATGQYWYALGVTFLGSCVGQFFNPARSALIPRVVGAEHLMEANSLGQTTFTIIQLTGPALGTTVFRLLGPTGSFSFDAASFFVSAFCIFLVAVPGAVAAVAGAGVAKARPSFVGEFKAGLQFGWQNKAIRVLFVAFSVLFLGAGAINSMGIFIVKNALNLDESLMAYPSTASTLAMLVASVAIGAAAKKLRRAPLLVPAGLLVGSAGILTMAGAPNLIWLIAGGVLVGICNTLLNLGMTTTMQALVPDHMRGRVFGVVSSIPTAGMLASAAAAGYLATQINPRLILGGAGAIILVAALVAFAGLREVVLPTREPEPAPQAA